MQQVASEINKSRRAFNYRVLTLMVVTMMLPQVTGCRKILDGGCRLQTRQ